MMIKWLLILYLNSQSVTHNLLIKSFDRNRTMEVYIADDLERTHRGIKQTKSSLFFRLSFNIFFIIQLNVILVFFYTRKEEHTIFFEKKFILFFEEKSRCHVIIFCSLFRLWIASINSLKYCHIWIVWMWNKTMMKKRRKVSRLNLCVANSVSKQK
jgi:hypothetical protein